MHGTSGEVVHDDSAESLALEPRRYDQVAKAASAGIMSHRQVDSAVVEISGPPGSLVFHLWCTLLPEDDPSATIDHISAGLIANVEKILGQAFVTHDLNFTFAQRA
ncbi:hypothetical protein [Nesterenkonia haasae]|uniref:hypothetical protein n=1 Tax=Nesterenkonia haasae TaxID=2587813 RepID=UPI001390E52D|nr:hypothetical protein [Nesterenkonia haasae]NDK32529.1 hypothetical protein [Nesterenkonia haasae]